MTWWGWLLWFVALLLVNVLVQTWVQRVKRRRGLRAGRVVVSARSVTPGTSPPRWRVRRVTLENGRLLLRRASDHSSQPGVELYSTAGPGRPLRRRLVLGMVVGAADSVPFHSSAGLVEVAAPREVLAWLEAQLHPGDPV